MKHWLTYLFIITCGEAASQQYYNDARLWVNVYLEKKITDKLIVHLNQKNRFNNNVSRFELGYADIGLTYKFNKNIKVLADYVFATKLKKNNSLSYRHQAYAAVIFSKEFKRWKFMYRNLFQVSYRDIYSSAEGFTPRYFDRNKFTVKYEITKRYSVYLAEELYLVINNAQAKGLSRSRSFAGLFIRTTKHQQLELYFCFQQQLQKINWYEQKSRYPNVPPERGYIYGIGYSIEL